MSAIKGFLISFFSAILSFFLPIGDFMVAMLLLFLLNFIFGLVSDIANGNHWQKRKAEMFFVYCFVFFTVAVSIFVLGHLLHAHNEAIQAVKYLCVVTVWFFSVNITRNWMNITPKSSTFHKLAYFIHYVLSVQVIERIPYLKKFIEEKENEIKIEENSQEV